eukprot:Lankesteria_metandrocarpae@DN10969_c0_g1_i1.p1
MNHPAPSQHGEEIPNKRCRIGARSRSRSPSQHSKEIPYANWWYRDGKAFANHIPGGAPVNLGNNCIEFCGDTATACHGSNGEIPVYRCKGVSSFEVCQRDEVNPLFIVRAMRDGNETHACSSKVYGEQGARALAYLTAEYGSNPSSRNENDKVVGLPIIKHLQHWTKRSIYSYERTSIAFGVRVFGKARAMILGTLAALLHENKSLVYWQHVSKTGLTGHRMGKQTKRKFGAVTEHA